MHALGRQLILGRRRRDIGAQPRIRFRGHDGGGEEESEQQGQRQRNALADEFSETCGLDSL